MSEEGVPVVSPGSHLDPLPQSRGFFGGGQFPASPSGPGVIPDDRWKTDSNSFAKSGVACGVLAVLLGWIQIVGFLLALGFGWLAIILGAIGLLRSRRLPGTGGRYIALLALAIGIAVVVWKIIEGVGPATGF
jgi:hypothetical protein